MSFSKVNILKGIFFLGVLAWAITMTTLYVQKNNTDNTKQIQLKEEEEEEEDTLYPLRHYWWHKTGKFIQNIEERVLNLHKYLNVGDTDMNSEFPEQTFIAKHVNPQATVLELGGNVGRSTMVLASVMNDSSRLVVMETDSNNSEILERNRIANNFDFHLMSGALTKTPLMQSNWVSEPLKEPLPQGYFKVESFNLEDIQSKLPSPIDTLVVDCEGCLVPILEDFPELLNHVDTVVIENDFAWTDYMTDLFNHHNFKSIDCKELQGNPCFFQAFKK
jgi:FkbM family methyltransferase